MYLRLYLLRNFFSSRKNDKYYVYGTKYIKNIIQCEPTFSYTSEAKDLMWVANCMVIYY